MSRTLHAFLLTTLTTAVVVGLTVTTAPAASAAVAATSSTIVGDLTGDGLPDRITLGTDSAVAPTCSARVRPGLVDGSTAPGGVFRALPVRAANVAVCPDLGVVVPGPTPARARLAVTWSSLPPVGGRSVQFFRWSVATQSWTFDGGTNGQYQPSTLGSRDLDGDGYGDLVEVTDQGDGVTALVGRGSTYSQLWTSAPSTDDRLSFADFDHRAGSDILDGHGFYGSMNVGVTVVDGLTGAVVTLVDDTSAYGSTYVPQAVDVNGDGWLDVRVRVTAYDGTLKPTLVFRNRANGTLAFTRV